jgi:hypothetical protein
MAMPGTPHNLWPNAPDPPNATADEVAKQAIADVARHEEQIVKLILFHDDRALRVLSVYVPVIGVLIAGSIALYQASKMTPFIGLMIGGTGVSLFAGCLCAFAALWNSPIYLPARKPAFWKWAIDYDVDLRSVASAYVDQSIGMVAHNSKLSGEASTNLTKAYICGIAAPLVGAAIVWVVHWSKP